MIGYLKEVSVVITGGRVKYCRAPKYIEATCKRANQAYAGKDYRSDSVLDNDIMLEGLTPGTTLNAWCSER